MHLEEISLTGLEKEEKEKIDGEAARKMRKITIQMPEEIYRSMATRCYEQGKRIEQLVEEMIRAKFSK